MAFFFQVCYSYYKFDSNDIPMNMVHTKKAPSDIFY